MTNETFLTQISAKPTLVKFYAPWCGHCKELKPKYESVAETLDPTKFAVAELDCTQFQDVCEAERIEGFPTLRLYQEGDNYEYHNEREAQAIVTWVQLMQQPVLSYVDEASLAKSAEEQHAAAYFLVTTDSLERSEPIFRAFKGSIIIGAISGPPMTLTAVRENISVSYNGTFDPASLEQFVVQNSLPFCPILNPHIFTPLLQSGMPAIVLSANGNVAPHMERVEELQKLARAQTLPLVYGILDNQQYKQFVNVLRGDDDLWLFVFRFRQDDDVFGRKVTELPIGEQIRSLLDDIKDGKISAIEMQQPEDEKKEEAQGGEVPQEENKIVKIVNTILFGGVGAAGVLAIWFACKCMTSNQAHGRIEVAKDFVETKNLEEKPETAEGKVEEEPKEELKEEPEAEKDVKTEGKPEEK